MRVIDATGFRGQRGYHLEDPDRIRVAAGVEGEVTCYLKRGCGTIEAGGEVRPADILPICQRDSIGRSARGVAVRHDQIDLGRG